MCDRADADADIVAVAVAVEIAGIGIEPREEVPQHPLPLPLPSFVISTEVGGSNKSKMLLAPALLCTYPLFGCPFEFSTATPDPVACYSTSTCELDVCGQAVVAKSALTRVTDRLVPKFE